MRKLRGGHDTDDDDGGIPRACGTTPASEEIPIKESCRSDVSSATVESVSIEHHERDQDTLRRVEQRMETWWGYHRRRRRRPYRGLHGVCASILLVSSGLCQGVKWKVMTHRWLHHGVFDTRDIDQSTTVKESMYI